MLVMLVMCAMLVDIVSYVYDVCLFNVSYV